VVVKDLTGRVAVVTGGASGIGRATGVLLAEQGMKVVLADIEQPALDDAVAGLTARSLEVSGVPTDVSDLESVKNLERQTRRLYGNVHVLVLNAGVSIKSRPHIWDFDESDWKWGMAVNVYGVVNGVKAFLGGMVEHGEEGHVVITSSSVAIAPVPAAAVYSLTKAAITNLGESLYGQLHTLGCAISASVLIPPGTINTNLFTSARNRQPEFGRPDEVPQPFDYDAFIARMNAAGNPRRAVEAKEVAEYVLDAVRNDIFWVLPGPRHDDVQATFDQIIRHKAESMLGRTPPDRYLQAST
jgi:NAD(P)-dependent dehydrogenase (short-subunit alcohol dehydrogenase family)